MKNFVKKLIQIIDVIYGWGILIALFVGGLTFFGFLAAFFIGGETATEICTFIHKTIFKWLIYGGNIIVLLGLLNMYLKKQKSLTISDTNHEAG